MYGCTIACTLFVLLLTRFNAAQTMPYQNTELTFAEKMYVRFSNACRAIADLGTGLDIDQNDVNKSMKIILLQGNMTKTYPIHEAYTALTRPGVFDITKQTKLIIHGYMANGFSSFAMDLAKAYNSKEMFNVLVVDAETLLSQTYMKCVRNSRVIGKRLANMLANLETYGADSDDFHLLGISLGAHIAGWTGKYFQQYRQRRLGHVTGLDPAGPCFTFALSQLRLDRTDAKYVDVLHTNRLVQGVIEPLGHADFYLNGGGPTQPGCIMPKCSHLRAAEVYAESIEKPKSFVGIKCSNWKDFLNNACEQRFAVMGYGSPPETRGLFYLRTGGSAPFGLAMQGTKALPPNAAANAWLRTYDLTFL